MGVRKCAEEVTVYTLLDLLQDSDSWNRIQQEEHETLLREIEKGSSRNRIEDEIEGLLEDTRHNAFVEGMIYGAQLYIQLTKEQETEL